MKETDTLINPPTTIELFDLTMNYAGRGAYGYTGGLQHAILPAPDRQAPFDELPCPWRTCLRFDRSELVLELHGDVILGVNISAEDHADVVLNAWRGYELGVSRHHLMLRPTANSLFAIDLGSTNGSWYNDQKMTPSRAYPIRRGDLLTLGRLNLSVLRVEQVTMPPQAIAA